MNTEFCYSDYYANISIRKEMEKIKGLHIQFNYVLMAYKVLRGKIYFLAEQSYKSYINVIFKFTSII